MDKEKVLILVNKETIDKNNCELLMCEVKDYLENYNSTLKNIEWVKTIS